MGVFRFKQFAVDQGNCAMKINTDGVLLGSSTHFPQAHRILDIGTGTGVIALMLAQSHPEALVDAVELDQEAAEQADRNFHASPFADRLQLFAGSFVDMQPSEPYDLIVSNPPFYTNALHTPDARKRLAKHTDTTFFTALLAFVAQHLAEEGLFRLIVPAALADELQETLLPQQGLFVQQEMAIASFSGGEIIRKILGIGKAPKVVCRSQFVIYVEKGIYSEAYKTLLKPYFLAY